MSKYYHYPYVTKWAYENAKRSHRLYNQTHGEKREAYRSKHHDRYLYQQYRADARRYISIANLRDLAQTMSWIRIARRKGK